MAVLMTGAGGFHDVAVPPKIERQNVELSVVEEDKVMLPCRVSGRPPPVVRWTKDDVAVAPDDDRYRVVSSHWLAIPVVT